MSRLLDRRNAKRVNGLRRDPRTGAGKLAKSERGYGGVLAFDFTDNSAVVYDPTTQANVAYTQGVTDGNGNFRGVSSLLTYTSPSNKLTLQADGYIKYQAHNLCRYSETFQSWTASGAGTGATPTATNAFTTDDQGLSACRLQCDLQGGTSSGDISWFQGTTETPVSGAPYEITFRAKLNTGSSAVITIQQTGIGEVQRTITDVWSDYTVSAAATSTGATFYIGLRGARATANADTVDLLVSQLRFARTPANTDYIKTTSAAKYALPLEYDTSGNCLGLLVEEQRTNSALYSSVLDNAYWGVTNAVVASTSAQQPFLSGVYTLTPSTATSGVHRLIRSGPTNVITLGAAQSLVFSVYAKANGYTRIGLRESLTTGATCVFTLSGSGSAATPHSAGNITASNATIESVGNGWYRCAIVFTASSSTNTSPGVYVASPSYTSGDVESASWTPNGSDGVYVSQIDYCSGSFPTSPIITYGATATRAADNISIATSAFPYNQPEGAVYCYAEPSYIATGNYRFFELSGGPGARVLDCYTNNTTLSVYNGTGTYGVASALSVGTAVKIGTAYKTTDYAICADASAVSTNASATVNTATNLHIGKSNGAIALNGIIKAISYVPRRKDDIELAVDTGYSLPTGYTTYGAWDLFGDESSALAFDFTDQSVVNTKTPLVSQGIVSDGALVGPGAALTYTSPSNKLTMQSDGVMRYQAHNLLLYSEDLTQWTNSGTTDSGQVVTATAGGTDHYVYKASISSIADFVEYACTVRLQQGTHQYACLTFYGAANNWTAIVVDLSDGSLGELQQSGSFPRQAYSITAVGDGSYDVTLRAKSTLAFVGSGSGPIVSLAQAATGNTFSTSGATTWSAAGTETIILHRAHVYRYPANSDYIKTTSAAKYALPLEYDTSGNCLGLLVEEARTNILLGSGDTDNATYWLISNLTTATAEGLDDVSTSATTATASASTGSWRTSAELTLGAAAYTFSVYAKAGTTEFITLRAAFFTTNFQIGFNLSTGVADTGGVITDVGNGWYRCSVTWTPGGADVAGYMYIYPANALSATTCDIGDSVTIWGPQLEAGSFPTSPIITYGAAATRAVDNISIATSAFPHSTTATTMFVHAIPLVDNSSNVLLEKAAASRADSLTQIYTNGTGSLTIADRGAAFATQASFDEAETLDGLTAHKIAVSCQTNLFDASFNGSTETQDTSGTHQASAHTILYIGSGGTGAIKGNIIKQVKLLPRVSSAAELQAETT